jgi:hypothetical protein
MVATLICRYRVIRGKQVSWGTVTASSVIANVAVCIGMAFYEEGWSEPKGGWGGVVIVLSVISLLCILPALGVAVYYQKRSKKNGTHVV